MLDEVKIGVLKKLKDKNYYFFNTQQKPVKLHSGDIVYVQTYPQSSKDENFASKLPEKWRGPYLVPKENGFDAMC